MAINSIGQLTCECTNETTCTEIAMILVFPRARLLWDSIISLLSAMFATLVQRLRLTACERRDPEADTWIISTSCLESREASTGTPEDD